MNIETKIKPELWEAVVSSYQAENYTHAIRDAMSVVTEVLRDKSGLDGDGRPLVGQALGFGKGKQPKIKVNKLQTETERNVQQGLQEILRGMYGLIRNPRNHQILNDNKDTADAIILFVNHLLDILGASQQSFTIQSFLELVTDTYFVEDAEYVERLIETIPIRKRADTLIAIYREKNWEVSNNFRLVVRILLEKLTKDEVEDFLGVVSEELQQAKKGNEVGLVIKILPPSLWPRLEQMARLRAENMLTKLLYTAEFYPNRNSSSEPACTWIASIAEHFLRKDKLRKVILDNLKKLDFNYHNFIANYLFDNLPVIFETESQIEQCCKGISNSVLEGNEYVKDQLVVRLGASFISPLAEENWRSKFVKNLESLTDPKNPEIYFDDGTAFLGEFRPLANPAEIPF